MRVVIVGGRSRADYLMGALAETVDTVVAINDDRRFCEYLSSRHDGTVIWGNGMKLAVLEEAGIAGFDAIVALTGLVADNLAICQVAKKFLGIRIQLCIVSNPENTAIFRQLGVTAAISATPMMRDHSLWRGRCKRKKVTSPKAALKAAMTQSNRASVSCSKGTPRPSRPT